MLDAAEIKKKISPILYPEFDEINAEEAIFEQEDFNVVKIVVATRKTKNFESNPTLLQIRKTKAYIDMKLDYQLVHYDCDEEANADSCDKFMPTSKWISMIVVHKGNFQQYLGEQQQLCTTQAVPMSLYLEQPLGGLMLTLTMQGFLMNSVLLIILRLVNVFV